MWLVCPRDWEFLYPNLTFHSQGNNNIQKWLTCSFSLWYPYLIQQTDNENTLSYQVEAVILILPQILISDPHSYEHYLGNSKNKARKKFRPVQNLNPWPLQYQCSTLPTELKQANWELVIMLVPNKPVKWWINDCKYMKFIYVNCSWRNEYGSDPCSYEHYLSNNENKVWKNSGLRSSSSMNFHYY